MSMTFNTQQEEAIYSKQTLVVVAAGAGSGKTRVLTERVLHLSELAYAQPKEPHGAAIDSITAITFTEKAAREMKQRIRVSIENRIQSAPSVQEQNHWIGQKEALDRAVITTFHSFCQRLLHQHAFQADLPAAFQIIDDVDANLIKQDVLQSLFSSVDHFRKAEPFFEAISMDQLGDAIVQIHDQLRELVPGEAAIQQLDVECMWNSQVEASNQSWIQHMKAFDHAGKEAVRSFPTTGLSKANENHVSRLTEFFDRQTPKSFNEEYIKALTEVMPKRVNSAWKEGIPSLYDLFETQWKPLKERLKKKENSVDPKQTKVFLEKFMRLIQAFDLLYQERKMFQGVLDFADLQQKALKLLEDPDIQRSCREEFKHFMVDEFQDTNALQLEVLQRIQPMYRFLVGDTKQSIYQFRGADVTIMNDLEQQAQAADQRILMNKNYRTIEPIVSAVNTIFSHAMAQIQEYSYQTLYQPLDAFRTPNPELTDAVEVVCGEQEEYDLIANRMIELVRSKEKIVGEDSLWRPASWHDLSVLIPTRTHLRKLEKALRAKQIPYEVHSGVGFFERQEVVDFLTLLRWLDKPYEDFYVLALLRSPLIGLTINDFLYIKSACKENQSIGEYVCLDDHVLHHNHLPAEILNAIGTLRKWIEQWVPFQPFPSLEESCYELLEETGLKSALLLQSNGLQRVRNVEKLIEILADQKQPNLRKLLTSVQERVQWSEKQGDATVERAEGDTVTIMTVHGSKGLEFPVVFLPQLHQRPQKDSGRFRFHPQLGIVMNLEAKDRGWTTPGFELVKDEADHKAVEEAKRLFYVAATRAKDKLILINGEDKASENSWLHMIEQTKSTDTTWFTEKYVSDEEPWLAEDTDVYTPPPILKDTIETRVPISVSEIVACLHNPSLYFDQYLRERDTTSFHAHHDGEREYHLAANLVGTLVHRAIELVDLGWTDERAVTIALGEQYQTHELYKQYEREVNQLLSVYKQLSLGEQIANEWLFTMDWGRAEVTGIIDKVVVKNGEVGIVDFKTNVLPHAKEELINYYKPQLLLYKWAFEQRTGKAVHKLYLVLLRDKEQTLYEVKVTEQDEQTLKNTIENIVKLKTTGLTIETSTLSDRYNE
ncbi:UvrD-helicase domain-containing protein [Alkalicoccobacillus porphyridii]|uniref:DNA 3'-5' helicase n=1 Tax=Alkalicoccobacillus porphyridii TaxID=2597270 RepID=A0A553ZXJ8_9BACI|nr:UvrD-helicase domain-containing protein [Alkalicoccobacillus porphyridii]TSB46172.1 AAA family ATPase [Alkalicoccobacillus porphyridii]